MIDLASYLLAVSVRIPTSTRRSLCQHVSVDSLHKGLRLAEGAARDLVARNASLNQRVANSVDAAFAQGLVVLLGAARIRDSR